MQPTVEHIEARKYTQVTLLFESVVPDELAKAVEDAAIAKAEELGAPVIVGRTVESTADNLMEVLHVATDQSA